VEQKYVDELYREIGTLRVELEPDPTVLGARYIQSVTSKCRNYLNRISQRRVELSRMRRNLIVQIAGEETALSIEKDHLLAENDTVQRQPNIRDREAVVNTMLRSQVQSIASKKRDLLDVETVDKAVKLVHDELIRTSTEIKVQRSLLFSDRMSGSGYGDESPVGSNPPPPATAASSDINENELENLMKGTVPLVPVTKSEEEDPDLAAALASIQDEDPTPEVVSAETEEPAVKPDTTPEISSGVPSEVEASETPSGTDDDDLASFLEEKPAPAKATSKKPKAADESPAKVKLDDIDFDFEDVLSNV
jgi:hypothetical protein